MLVILHSAFNLLNLTQSMFYLSTDGPLCMYIKFLNSLAHCLLYYSVYLSGFTVTVVSPCQILI